VREVETATIHELIGYAASALIVLSLLMSSVLKLRWVNLVGAAVFTVYGLLIGSTPVVLANGAIVVIDVYHLLRLHRARATDAYHEVVEVEPDDTLVRRFVEFHLDDIRRFVPSFRGLDAGQLTWMVLRDAVPVGVVAARADGDLAHLEVDYVVPAHRDLRPGRHLYGPGAEVFVQHGIRRLHAEAGSTEHRRYLERMGFAPVDGSDLLGRRLDVSATA
jgi:N-acetylglutamate synthase-like GNAT family acetyltransferase